jgi:predicted DNA-binding transcriptional regulator AlpA
MTGRRTRLAVEATIEAGGGLFTQGGLQHQLGYSRAWMSTLVRMEGFPAPLVLHEGNGTTRNVWVLAEVMDWMKQRELARAVRGKVVA